MFSLVESEEIHTSWDLRNVIDFLYCWRFGWDGLLCGKRCRAVTEVGTPMFGRPRAKCQQYLRHLVETRIGIFLLCVLELCSGVHTFRHTYEPR